MNSRGSLFSEKEIQKMASPERLDTMVAVTKPRGWIVLTAFCLLITELLVWSIFGSLSLTITGQGILMKDRVIQIEAGSDGRVKSLAPVGGRVTVGTIIAELDLSSLAAEEKLESARLNDLTQENLRATPLEQADLKRKIAALNDELQKLPQQIASATEVLNRSKAEYERAQRNLATGIITQAQLNTALQASATAAADLQQKQTRYRTIEAEISNAATQTEEKIKARQLEIDNLQRKVAQMKSSLESGSKIEASVAGTILEHTASLDEIISPKTVLMTIEPDNTDMIALIFVPAEEAKKIPLNERGAPVSPVQARLNPSTVKPEEYGFMLGEVRDIAAYPSSAEGIKALLRNEALVQKLMEKGPPIQIRTTILKDSKVFSGFRWSSSGGPQVRIATGTMCKATFEVERRRPISYVIPAFKKTLGIQ
jgi:HlyD family secretion protein